ncbi:MAG: TetR/AcrR family transcriptional regulator [Chloroflexi bacterium]|nr:TetR/AcrR family transcriptional regulator [Chloroflexota bacterium]
MGRGGRLEDRREELLAAAIRVFLAHGYSAAKVSDIVAEAGVAQGTFYLYYRSKEHILHTLVERFMGGFIERLDSLREPLPRGLVDYQARVAAVLRATFSLCAENRQLARIFFHEALGADPSFGELLNGFYRQLSRRVQADLEHGIAGGYLRPLDAALVADALVGMGDMVVRRRIIFDQGDVDLDHLTSEVLSLELLGILRPSAGRAPTDDRETTGRSARWFG